MSQPSLPDVLKAFETHKPEPREFSYTNKCKRRRRVWAYRVNLPGGYLANLTILDRSRQK